MPFTEVQQAMVQTKDCISSYNGSFPLFKIIWVPSPVHCQQNNSRDAQTLQNTTAQHQFRYLKTPRCVRVKRWMDLLSRLLYLVKQRHLVPRLYTSVIKVLSVTLVCFKIQCYFQQSFCFLVCFSYYYFFYRSTSLHRPVTRWLLHSTLTYRSVSKY